MKTLKFLTLTLSFLLFVQLSFGQEKSNAFLHYEGGNDSCGLFLAEIDSFFLSINNTPSAKGYIIFYKDDDFLMRNFSYEQILNGQLEFRKYDKTLIKVVRAKQKNNSKFQFWIVPQNASEPSFEEENDYFRLSKSTKPFMLHKFDHIDYCPSGGFEDQFVNILKFNPEAHGHLVIYEKSKKRFEQTKKQLLKSLSEISVEQLRFFYVKSKLKNLEYWIVPKSNK